MDHRFFVKIPIEYSGIIKHSSIERVSNQLVSVVILSLRDDNILDRGIAGKSIDKKVFPFYRSEQKHVIIKVYKMVSQFFNSMEIHINRAA